MMLQKLVFAALVVFCSLVFWGFMIGWFATGSALESAKHGALFLLWFVFSPIRWIFELLQALGLFELVQGLLGLVVLMMIGYGAYAGVSSLWSRTGYGKRLDWYLVQRLGEPYLTSRIWWLRTNIEDPLAGGVLSGAGAFMLYQSVLTGGRELTVVGHVVGVALVAAAIWCVGRLGRHLWELRQWLRRRNLPEDLAKILVQAYGPRT